MSDRTDDEREITRLLAEYTAHLDRREDDAWLALFAPDCEFHVYGRVFRGLDELMAITRDAPGGLHLSGAPVIDVDGGHATARQSFLFVDQDTRAVRIGFYDDDLIHIDGSWRFQIRRSTFLNPGGVSARPAEEPVAGINRLLTSYGSLLDRGEYDAWLALFAEPSSLVVDGRPQLDTMEARRRLAETAPKGVHMANPPLVTQEGDVATSVQTFLFWNAETATGRAGWYEDELRLDRGSWKFARRVIHFQESKERP
jgi:3-phenylpropionate/cinnamic acid dioxygenase small subunit